MGRIKGILVRINSLRALKYVAVVIVGVVLVGFVGENSVWSHLSNVREIAALKAEIEHYTERYRHDDEQLRLLDRDPKAIEKIARERYFMKADDEDIFVLSDDERQPRQTASDETTE